MSTADYAAKYQKRKGWLEKIEKAWLDEAQRERPSACWPPSIGDGAH